MGGGRLRTGLFAGSRGRQLAWSSWGVDESLSTPRGLVVIAHGFGEHSGRYQHVAERLTYEDYAVIALDHHGHGRSSGTPGRISFPDAVADLDRLIVLAAERFPATPIFLLGHSMGGALALRYAMEHGERLDGLIVSAPLVEVEGRGLSKLLGRFLGVVAPRAPVARLDPTLVSRDPEVVRAYVEDPLVYHKPIPAGTAAEFLRHAATLPDEVSRVTLPTLLLFGTADRLCAPAGAELVAQRIGSADLTVKAYRGLHHEILNEPERARVLEDITGWLAERAPVRSGAVRGRRGRL